MADRDAAVLVTGAAGFIGYHVAERLLARGDRVVGLDNLNDYYDVTLKEARLARLAAHAGFEFARLDLADRAGMERVFAEHGFARIVHLAAQAGVRYSLVNPHVYVHANVVGFLHVLEGCRSTKASHVVFASTSSVYGLNTRMPFSVHDNVDHPVSLYAASKKANELMAHSYAYLFGVPCTGLRFFTVYGPWGRPDMAMFLFTKAILAGKPIDVFNRGHNRRDFTYIDDIVEGVVRILDRPPIADPAWDGNAPDPGSSPAPYRVFNIGNRQPVETLELIRLLEVALGKPAVMNLLPSQPGDVLETCADVDELVREVGFRPATSLADGVERFIAWYREYHRC